MNQWWEINSVDEKIFEEESEKQQQSLLKLIRVNFELTMKEKYIKSEVYELKKNIKFTEDFVLKKTFRICTEKLVA